METVYRRATRTDASDLDDIRRRSILELVHPTMTAAEAQAGLRSLRAPEWSKSCGSWKCGWPSGAAPADNHVDPTVSSGLDCPS
ncbi:hypothetical protein V1277_005445 [Bradyrhizobium sp. AZCC 1588]